MKIKAVSTVVIKTLIQHPENLPLNAIRFNSSSFYAQVFSPILHRSSSFPFHTVVEMYPMQSLDVGDKVTVKYIDTGASGNQDALKPCIILVRIDLS